MKNKGMREKKGMRNEIVEGIFKTEQNMKTHSTSCIHFNKLLISRFKYIPMKF